MNDPTSYNPVDKKFDFGSSSSQKRSALFTETPFSFEQEKPE